MKYSLRIQQLIGELWMQQPNSGVSDCYVQARESFDNYMRIAALGAMANWRCYTDIDQILCAAIEVFHAEAVAGSNAGWAEDIKNFYRARAREQFRLARKLYGELKNIA